MADDVRNISDLDKKGEWVSLEVKVVKLWDPKSDAIAQSIPFRLRVPPLR